MKLPVLSAVPPRSHINTNLPEIEQALAWRSWEAGLAEARHRRAPIIGLAESGWTNSAQRLGLVLGQDQHLRTMLADEFVPVLVDPIARPDLAAWWRWAAISLTGAAGPPLLVLLTPDGLPFLSFCSMWPEGRAPLPSLASLARATLDAWAQDPAALIAASEQLQALATSNNEPPFASPRAFWESIAVVADQTHGGFQEEPKHPHPQLLWMLLELDQGDDAPNAGELVRLTLRRMVKGGINDQLDRGFHRCARDERWIVPHFEKPVPLNAQLAAVYAKAARTFADETFGAVAGDLIRFCLTGLKGNVDAAASDSNYYTWTSGEVYEHLDPELVQAVALHYHLTPDDSRQVLYRAMEPEAMNRYSYEPPDVLRRRIARGRRQLGHTRSQRPPPRLVRVERAAWRAESIRWLMTASEQGSAVPIPTLERYLAHLLAACQHRAADVAAGAGGDHGPWLEDQAALLAAIAACARVTGSEQWLTQGRDLATIVLDQYSTADGWRASPNAGSDRHRSGAVTDHMLPSTIGTLTDALFNLSQLLGDDHLRQAALRTAAPHLASASSCGHWSAGLWRAWFRASETSVPRNMSG